jgi:outer membrane biosynthesis protein TonB
MRAFGLLVLYGALAAFVAFGTYTFLKQKHAESGQSGRRRTPILIEKPTVIGVPSASDAASNDASVAAPVRRRRKPTRRRVERARDKRAPTKAAVAARSKDAGVDLPAVDAKKASLPSTADKTTDAGVLASKKVDAAAPKKHLDAAVTYVEQKRAQLDAQSITWVIRRKLTDISSCHERIAKRGVSVGGRVEIRFVVGPTGTVTRATVHRNTTGQKQLATCIAARIARITFPRPISGEVEFIYPFVFSSRR